MSSLSSLILKTLHSGWCLRWMRFSGSQTCEHGCFACKKSGESSWIPSGSRFVLVFGLLCFIGRSTHPWKEVHSWLENMPFFYGDLNLVSLSESDSFAFERDFQQCFLKFWLVVVYIRGLYYPLYFGIIRIQYQDPCEPLSISIGMSWVWFKLHAAEKFKLISLSMRNRLDY